MKICWIAVLCAACAVAQAEDAVPTKSGPYVEPKITHDAYGPLKLVFPIMTDDSHEWMARLQHASNAMATVGKWGGSADVKIVLYGPGIMLATHQDDDLGQALARVRAQGAQVLVCNNALRGFDVDYHTLNRVSDADIVPAGVLEVGYLQTKGYELDF